jgi:hypothetical protein
MTPATGEAEDSLWALPQFDIASMVCGVQYSMAVRGNRMVDDRWRATSMHQLKGFAAPDFLVE